MKNLTALALLLLSALSSAAAPSFIIYSKGDYSLVTPTLPATKPTDPARSLFLVAVQSELAQGPHYHTQMTLQPAPAPDWGKVIESAGGRFQFQDTIAGGFLLEISLEGLTPGQAYRLCLNGNPKLAGNDRLVDVVPGMPDERYYDFFTVTADARGRYSATFALALPAGPYDVRLYVKDASDHAIFLYHDYFRFEVKER